MKIVHPDPKYLPVESKEKPGWFEIPGYSLYLAHPDGKLYFKRTGHETFGGLAGRYRKVAVFPDGSDMKTYQLQYVHILICTAFQGFALGYVVMHGDDNRLNNTRSNLSWGTQKENVEQIYRNGRRFIEIRPVAGFFGKLFGW